jgi:hypothetical protein
MLSHDFPSIFVGLLHVISWISGKLCLQTVNLTILLNICTEIINCPFSLLWHWKCYKGAFIGFAYSCTITMYLILSKND